jgi:hypothetical protein
LIRIGVTGHMDLTPNSASLVRVALTEALAPHVAEGITGVSCIAPGSDSIFAEIILDLGGDLEVIIPASDYRQRKVKPEHAELFDNLIHRATQVRTMPHHESNRRAYEAANDALIDSVEILMAVWDGNAPADQGGTAAVVDSARTKDLPLEIIWPAGAQRRSRRQP